MTSTKFSFLGIGIGLVYLLLACYANASSFRPNCTLPPPGTNYVSGPNTRGTTSILWNCLSIIFLCTWSIQHLNVPAGRPKADSTLQKLWWAILDSRTKIKWTVITILVPEYLVGKAFGEKLEAMSGTKMKNFPSLTERNNIGYDFEWEEIHAYMANMGYFVLDFSDLLDAQKTTSNGEVGEETSKRDIRLQTAPANSRRPFEHLIEEHRIYYRHTRKRDDHSLAHRCWALDNQQWFEVPDPIRIRKMGPLASIPNVSSRQLEKIHKGGTLAKAIAVLQVIYLTLQLIVRKITNLPCSQIEIATLAFAASSLITYGLYWNKPQDVESVHIVKANRLPTVQDVDSMLYVRSGDNPIWKRFRDMSRIDDELDLAPISNDCGQSLVYWKHVITPKLPKFMQDVVSFNMELLVLSVGVLIGGTIFGGLHCLAWNFHFPTPKEALAWRVCSVTVSGLPLITTAVSGFWMNFDAKGPRSAAYLGPSQLPSEMDMEKDGQVRKTKRRVLGWIVVVLLSLYILARLFLMVEIFRTLFFLPPEAFIDTWSGSFPHLG
jgi:hypothetical protein